MAEWSKPELERYATRAAKRHGVSPNVLKALINRESGWRVNAHSNAGAEDIAQFIPSTAKAYGVTLGDNDPRDDLNGAAEYLAANLKRTGGNYKEALSIYNSGRPDTYKDPNFANGQTYNYVRSILGAAKNMGGVHAPASGGGTTLTIPGQPKTMKLTEGTEKLTVADPEAVRKQFFAEWLQQHDPNSLLLKLGVVDPNMPTTKTVTLPTTKGFKMAGGTPSQKVTVGSLGKHPAPHQLKQAKGVATFEGKKVAAWIAPILHYARQHGWAGTITSGYRSYADQSRIYNSGVRPAAKPGTSNHEGDVFPRGAVDVSGASQLSSILKKSPYGSLLVWAGGKDPVHFSHPHNGGY